MGIAEFEPLESFRRLFTHWWFVLGMTFLGGLIGWSVHFFQPPVYEAHAEIIITLNNNASPLLSQYDEDLAINTAGGLIPSNTVIEGVIGKARLQGINLDVSKVQQSFIAEREDSSWILRVRNSNPETAAILANLWAEQAYTFFLSPQQKTLLSPLLLFGIGATAATPDQPVVYGIALLTFAGALIGFLLGSGILALQDKVF